MIGMSSSYGMTYGAENVAALRELRKSRAAAPQSPATSMTTSPEAPCVPQYDHRGLTAVGRQILYGAQLLVPVRPQAVLLSPLHQVPYALALAMGLAREDDPVGDAVPKWASSVTVGAGTLIPLRNAPNPAGPSTSLSRPWTIMTAPAMSRATAGATGWDRWAGTTSTARLRLSDR